jgi:tetratricopeptide (TPR) repeat protein
MPVVSISKPKNQNIELSATLVEKKNINEPMISVNDPEFNNSEVNNILGALIMVKNEETSIQVTIDSVKQYIKHIIVYDTGSTDKTIKIIKNICKQNGQILHLKEGVFEGFPQSRNISLDFAETVPVKFLLLMDAGDEFRSDDSPFEFLDFIRRCPKDIGSVRKQWLFNNKMQDHSDIRFIRNHSGRRYDLDHPVHETLTDIDSCADLSYSFYLFQNRELYGGSSQKRYNRDIELLIKSKPTKRNLHSLSMTYFILNDYENSYKYALLSFNSYEGDTPNTTDACCHNRAGICAYNCKLPEETIIGHFLMSIKIGKESDTMVDPYIYILKYYIESGKPEKALPYLEELMNLEIKPFTKITINHEYFNYHRWYLISIVCLATKQKLHIGYEAIKKILHYNKPDDINNYKLYLQIYDSGNTNYSTSLNLK